MKIVIIGSGKVATWMGKTFMKNNHEIVQVYSREKKHAENLAAVLKAEYTSELHELNTTANLYLIAIADNGIEEVLSNLPRLKGIIINTSGSMDISILKNVSQNYGVMWPMVSVTKEMSEAEDFAMIIEASDDETGNKLNSIASLFTNKIIVLSYQQRQLLHLAAVFSNNFPNHLIALAQKLLNENKIDITVLQPMLKNMLEKLQKYPAKELQSGPALRNDTVTMQKHLELLKDKPQLEEIYEVLSESIRDFT